MAKVFLILSLICIVAVQNIFPQAYSVSLIPDSLKQNAHCVIRDLSVELELKSINKGTENCRRVVTILDKEGEKNAVIAIPYDKNSDVTFDQITIYDRDGKKVSKIKQSEIKDIPAFSDFELYSDDRIKYFSGDFGEFPYTLEYEYKRNLSNCIDYGKWAPFNGYNISAEHFTLTLTYPNSCKINRKEINNACKKRSTEGNMITEEWSLGNIKAIEEEPFEVSLTERIPAVYLMPAELDYDNYQGPANTWAEYGKWISDLYKGKDELPETEKAKVFKLVKDKPDTLDRIKALYAYMQDNTRYVAVSLGLGGYQPFSAKTVAATGYGDCKALSNYMHSLLKVTGVESFPALVSSGRYIQPVFADFPNFQQFDHVILCVPYHRDTIWLECTSQDMPFGFLGDFTDDRDVLLMTGKDGKFAHTKRYPSDVNQRICNARFTIDSTGSAACTMRTLYKGLQYHDITALIRLDADKQKKWLYSNSTLPSVQIRDFSITNNKTVIPSAIVSESLQSKSFASFSGKYMLVALNQVNVQDPIRRMLRTRLSDILINRSSEDYDTLVYMIPAHDKIESVPERKEIRSDFGNYSSSATVQGDKVVFTRKFILNQGRYKPDRYKDLYEFFLGVSKADNVKLMLKRAGD